jgi:penicillin amidase
MLRVLLLLIVFALSATQAAWAEDFTFPGLSDTVTVYEDALGITTIVGKNENDVYFVQGYIQARDRFFIMDYFRKLAAGRLAELLGPAALPSDVQLRTFGLERAALTTWQNADAKLNGHMQAFTNGINTWLANNPLPPEYSVLELTEVEPWSPVHTYAFAKLLAFQLSFDLDTDATIKLGAYNLVGSIGGFDGQALYFEDIFRSQPPDGRVTVPGFLGSIGGIGQASPESAGDKYKARIESAGDSQPLVSETTLALAIQAQEKFAASDFLKEALKPLDRVKGSNEWAVSGDKTESGNPLVANDPHLALNTPSTWYQNSLVFDMGDESYSVSGDSFNGTPGVVLGCNERICWGATVHPMDVSDVFQDQAILLPLPGGGLPTHTVHNGVAEPVKTLFQSFFMNVAGNGEANSIVRADLSLLEGGITILVPRRNFGPVIAFMGDQILTVQYTGFGPTQELRAFLNMNRARDLEEYQAALQYFDFGSQNFIYADVDGNIGYFTSAENPIRADLAQGFVDGLPPWFIRDGSGALANEWLPVMNPQPGQAIPFEIMPQSEMPHLINPEKGYIANANNDPIGTTLDNNPLNQLRPGGNGIYYLNFGYVDYRMGRIDRELKEQIDAGVPVSMQDMMDLQGNVDLLDAELTLPILLGVMAEVPVPPSSPMAQALDVLSTWDYSTPTGLAEGWDAGDDPDMAVDPDETEIRNSAAATVFALWRSMLIQNTIHATLSAIGLGDFLPGSTSSERAFNWHLKNFPTNGGIGASGIPFFSAGLGPTVAGSLQQALELLASDEFAPAFGNSTDVMDYRWGALHRITFDHPFDVDPFNIPNGGGFSDLGPGLTGVARQGGYEAVDASTHSSTADTLDGFKFGSGASRRFLAEMTPAGTEGYDVIPGGQSGIFLHPNYSSQLPLWLTNSYHPLPLGEEDGMNSAVFTHTFNPAN